MVRYVVNVGRLSEQLGAIIEVHSNHKRTWLGRAMNGDAREEFSANLQCPRTVGRTFLYTGQLKSDFPYGIEVDGAFGHPAALRR